MALERFGCLDAVVAAAGVQPVAELAGMTVADWPEVLAGNASGAFATVQAAAAAMRGRGGSTGRVIRTGARRAGLHPSG